MEITLKSKFKLRQKLFYMDRNKICSSTVKGIIFPSYMIGSPKRRIYDQPIRYLLHKRIETWASSNSIGIPESVLFESRNALIKSL